MQVAEGFPRTRGFGAFEADLRAAELRKFGIRIKLQEQPFQILSLLLEHPGEVVTRDELRQKLWPAHTFVDFDRSLNKAMTKLRAALGDSAGSPRYVETIPRHGYRFLAPVHVHPPEPVATVSPGDALHLELLSKPSQPLVSIFSLASLAAQARSTSNRTYGLSAIAFAVVISLFVYMRPQQPAMLGGFPALPSPRSSVAVLGFTNLSGDPHEAWLSTAFSDWLSTELTAGEQVRAIPAESVARMKMELALPDVDSLGPESLIRIRKNLGTDYVVAGSYALLGDKSDAPLRLDLRLQDTRSGETVGAISEAGTPDRLLDLVSRAGERLREKLGVRAVTREEAAEVATALPLKNETTRLYSEGRAKLRAFDALSARNLLSEAVRVEPNFALSHAALATAWSRLGYDENARAEAKKAFDLSTNLSRADRLLTEGLYREMSLDWEKAIEINRALFKFFPDNLDYGLALVNAQVHANRWKEALDTIAALRELAPPSRDDPRIDLAEGYAARSLGDGQRADSSIAKAADKARASGASLLLARARLDQAWTYENLGRFSEVEEAVREAKQLYITANDRRGVAEATTIGAIGLRNEGDYLGARKDYEEALTLYRQIGYRSGLAAENDNIGDTLIYLGDLPAALRSYDAAFSIYHEIGDLNGQALAKLGLGDVFLALGDRQKADEMYQGSLDISLQTGNRGRQAEAVAGIGRVHGREGNFSQALSEENQARQLFVQIGDKTEVAHVDLNLAELLLDQGSHARAAASAKQAAEAFAKTRATSDEAAANLLIALTLFEEGRTSECRKVVDQVMGVATQTHNRELEFSAAIIAARIKAASGNSSGVHAAMADLNRILADATTARFANAASEARLALGEIQMRSGERAAGRALLESLQKDSSNAGFLVVAHKAAAALRVAPSGSVNSN
jgi:DNA-binding winged helix-turn-helix (wHTH) protein/tetratricopeptide (TPR) repeat protein